VRKEIRVEVGLEAGFMVDGARKSRCKSCGVAALLYALEDRGTILLGLMTGFFAALFAKRKQDAQMLDEGAIVAMLTMKFR
jgi:hypothetical protein